MDIGKSMKLIREERGIRQTDMARKLGMRPQSLWKIETGKGTPKMTTIEKFCKAANVPKMYLMLRSLKWPDDLHLASNREWEDLEDVLTLACRKIERIMSR